MLVFPVGFEPEQDFFQVFQVDSCHADLLTDPEHHLIRLVASDSCGFIFGESGPMYLRLASWVIRTHKRGFLVLRTHTLGNRFNASGHFLLLPEPLGRVEAWKPVVLKSSTVARTQYQSCSLAMFITPERWLAWKANTIRLKLPINLKVRSEGFAGCSLKFFNTP